MSASETKKLRSQFVQKVHEQILLDEFLNNPAFAAEMEQRGLVTDMMRGQKDAQLQAAAEAIQQELIGRPNPAFRKREARYVFDDDNLDGVPNAVDVSIGRSAPSDPVYINPDGTVTGGRARTLSVVGDYIDVEEAFGKPIDVLSHKSINPNNDLHVAVATGKLPPNSRFAGTDEAAAAIQIHEASKANDPVAYVAANIERNVPLAHAKEYVDRLRTLRNTSTDLRGVGPVKSTKIMDYLKGSGNSGREDIELMGRGRSIRSFKEDPSARQEYQGLLGERGGSLAQLLVNTGFRSANDPTPGMQIPGVVLEMDHAIPQSVVGVGAADDPRNHSFLIREANGETKNDRDLAETMRLYGDGLALKREFIEPSQPRKKYTGDDMSRQLYVDSKQEQEFGRKLTDKMAQDRGATYDREARRFARQSGRRMARIPIAA